MEFRVNFLAKLLQNVTWTGFFILILLVVYSKTDSVGGWNRGAGFLLAGTIFLLDHVMRGFFWSVIEIPESIRQGSLDFVLTKPVDSQFWVSTRKFDIAQIGAILVAFGVIVYGTITAGFHPNFIDIVGFLLLMSSSILIFYSLNFMTMTLAIYWVRVDNLWVLSDTAMGMCRFPIDIYGTWVQKIFTYAVPIAFLAHFPASQLKSGAQPMVIVGGVLWSIAMFIVARWFWQRSLLSYGSASS
jgi:ABC-2 type transport system permease protein